MSLFRKTGIATVDTIATNEVRKIVESRTVGLYGNNKFFCNYLDCFGDIFVCVANQKFFSVLGSE